MKKILLLTAALISVAGITAQDLDTIIRKHLEAINASRMAGFSTLAIKGTLSQQGMQLTMEMYEKAPDKLKAVSTFNGMEIVQVINGDRGYMINPMMGSAEPVALTAEQVSSIRNNSMLRSSLDADYREGRVEMEGQQDIDGRPSYKIRAIAEDGTERYLYIDKETFYINQISMEVSQMGMEMMVDMKMDDYRSVEGVPMAHTINTYTNGQPGGSIIYTSIEVNKELDDSIFEIK